MSSLRAWRLRFTGLFDKERKDRELAEELESHLQMHIQDNLRLGMSPAEARRNAVIKLGGVEQVKEKVRAVRAGVWLETLWQDLSFGVRMLRKNLGFTIVAVLTLALGIGASTAIFSVVNAVLLRPLPYSTADQLVVVWEKTLQVARSGLSAPDFLDYRKDNQVFDKMAAFTNGDFTLVGDDVPESLRGGAVTSGFFEVLGAQPILGRTFVSSDEQLANSHVVILSFTLWQHRFGADPQVLGKVLKLNDIAYTVVGVLGPTFEFALPGYFRRAADIWVPFATDDPGHRRANHFLRVIASLRQGVSRERAEANMGTIAQQLGLEYPNTNADETIGMDFLQNQMVENSRPALLTLLGAVAFVLMIAAANVASLLLSRVADRKKEFAIVSALGASRWRIARRLLLEATLLSCGGGCFGILLAYWSIPVIKWLSPINIPRLNQVNIDPRVLLFALGICIFSSVAIGILPALTASQMNLSNSLKEGSRSTSSPVRDRVRTLLVISEVAISVALLIGAGLLIRSFVSLTMTNPGFKVENVMSVVLSLPRTKYPDQLRQLTFFEDVLEGIKATPGVEFAATINDLPQGGDRDSTGIVIAGQPPEDPAQQPQIDYRVISPDYFRVMQIQSREGRSFAVSDRDQSVPVVIVNEAFARRFFPHEDPIGKHIVANFDIPHPQALAREIVGVVGDVRDLKMSNPPEPEVYAPAAQEATPYAIIVVRNVGNPLRLASEIRKSVWSVDKDQPLSDMLTMNQVLAEGVAPERFRSTLLGTFGVTALFLAAVGIYGLISYQVRGSIHEIGIRMALGARRQNILKIVIGHGIRLTLIGVCVGIAGALVLTRFLSSLLFGITPADPITFVSVAVLLLTVALLACYIPARRATRVDPMVALRYE